MNLLQYIGHFHPVLVHLPIGILLAAIALEWLSHRKGSKKLRKAVKLLLILGFLSAVLSCLTGLLLSQSGEYDADLLKTHQWLGISVAMLSMTTVLLAWKKPTRTPWVYSIMIFALAILIVLTGHAGGELTHGVDFLKPPPLANWFDAGNVESFGSINLKTAAVYKDLVAPIFEKKCKACHGPSRQKGKLRLDEPGFILKGGKDGPVLDTTSPRESEIFKRIHLDLSEEDHMPPREKNQLSRREIIVLSYWIETGTDFKIKLSALPDADSIFRMLTDDRNVRPAEKMVLAPDAGVIETFRKGGVVCSFLASGTGYVSLSFEFADTTRISSLLRELPKIQQQVVDLKLKDVKLAHRDWSQISVLTSLRRLNLVNSNISDEDMTALQSLHQLQYLNLMGTRVTISGLEKLKSIPGLTELFLYRSGVHEGDLTFLRARFPKASIDFGNYHVPTNRDDTTILTKPISK